VLDQAALAARCASDQVARDEAREAQPQPRFGGPRAQRRIGGHAGDADLLARAHEAEARIQALRAQARRREPERAALEVQADDARPLRCDPRRLRERPRVREDKA